MRSSLKLGGTIYCPVSVKNEIDKPLSFLAFLSPFLSPPASCPPPFLFDKTDVM